MKNFGEFLLGLAVAVSLTLIAITTSPAAEKTTTLKLVTVDPSTSTNVSAVPVFQKLVEEKSKGRLKIDWIGGPEITPGKKQPAAVQKGVVDLSLAWAYVLHVPEFRVAHLSLLTPPEERKSKR